MLTAALEAVPRSELRRLYAVAKEILQEDAHSDESSDPTVLSDWKAPDQGDDLPSAVEADLLGLGTESGSGMPGSSSDAGPAVPVAEGWDGITAFPDSGGLSATEPADLDDHESDDSDAIEPLPEWEWDQGEPSSSAEPAVPVTTADPAVAGASPSPLAGAPPPWLQALDLNAMDDDPVPLGRPPARAPTVAAPPDFSDPPADAAPGTGPDHGTPLPSGSTTDVSLAAASLSQAPPADAPPALPVAQAVAAPPPQCRLELSGSAELPYLHAIDVLQGLEIPAHVLPLRFPLQRLPKVLRDHGHSLSGYCAAPCRARCGFSCGRPVSNTSRRSHGGHYCSQCRRD